MSAGLRHLRHRLPGPELRAGPGSPVVGGLQTATALSIRRRLVPLDLVAMDVVEVAPI